MDNKRLMLPDVLKPPQRNVAPEPAQTRSSNGGVVTAANVLMTVIIIVGMAMSTPTVWLALVVGALYFLVSTSIFQLSDNGTLAAMFATAQTEKTERHRLDSYLDAIEIWQSMQTPYTTPAPVERISPLNERYVAPYAEGAQQEALQWIAGLYDRSGKPDPKKVNSDGRLRVKMLGSKRGGGSRDAGVWLIRTGLIQRVDGGYALDLKRVPHRSNLSHFQ